MAPRPLTDEQVAAVLAGLDAGLTQREVVAKTGVSSGSVGRIALGIPVGKAGKRLSKLLQQHQKREQRQEQKLESIESSTEYQERTDDTWRISMPKTRIKTLEALCEACGVDRRIWEVEKWTCNKSEVGMKPAATTMLVETEDGREIPMWTRDEKDPIIEELWHIKAWFRRNKVVSFVVEQVDKLKEESRAYSPSHTYFIPKQSTFLEIAAELFNTDHHTGALIDGWSMARSQEAWNDSFFTLCNRVGGYKPTLAVIPLGSDQQNFDDLRGMTSNLTQQQNAAFYYDVFEQSKKNSKFAIDMALQRFGKVHVPIVPGNHDRLSAWHLGNHLEDIYRNNPAVTIDNSRSFRKWWEFGVVMVMWEHGDKGKPPDYGKIMASNQPEMWGRTKWREAHTAHIHTRRVFEDIGYTVRFFPSLRPACGWTTDNHLDKSIQASEALVWSAFEGLIGQATYSILKVSDGKEPSH